MDFVKINSSYSLLKGSKDELERIYEKWKVMRTNARFDPLVQRGFKSPYIYFTKWMGDNLAIMNGHAIIDGILQEDEVGLAADINNNLPMKPYAFQIKALETCLNNNRCLIKMCTGSGKSLVIAMLADTLVKANYKGLLLVPNINLLEQFKSDIESYNLNDLYNSIEMFGGGNKPTFDKPLLISTWQSLQNIDIEQCKFDFLIADECHRYSSDVTSSIIQRLKTTSMRWGFTGTIPDAEEDAMMLKGLFGPVRTLITSRELINYGLGTPIVINTIWLHYNREIKMQLRAAYPTALKILKTYQPRNELIENLAVKLMSRKQNTLVLYSHTAHGKTIFSNIVKKIYPEVTLTEKDITGSKSFERQKELGIYFVNGEDDAQTRELTRKALSSANGSILVSNYAILGTGINIKSLHNLIMASPLKSYTTITQSIGRGIRLHESKTKFNVYDIVDDTNLRGCGGPFVRQYKERLAKSYKPEGYQIVEANLNI